LSHTVNGANKGLIEVAGEGEPTGHRGIKSLFKKSNKKVT